MFSEQADYGDTWGETPQRAREPLFQFGRLRQSDKIEAAYTVNGEPVIVRTSRFGKRTVDERRTAAAESGQVESVIADALHQGAAVVAKAIRRTFSD
jgi:hypothetical protein